MDSGIFTLLLTDGTQGLERCVNRKVIIIFCPIVYFIEPWRYRDLRQDILVNGKYIVCLFAVHGELSTQQN